MKSFVGRRHAADFIYGVSMAKQTTLNVNKVYETLDSKIKTLSMIMKTFFENFEKFKWVS